jgi:S1-C subfamily serine protease
MLTPEDQKRIEEEEQYRAQVRARYNSFVVPWKPLALGLIIALLVVAAAVVTGNLAHRNSSVAESHPEPPPVAQKANQAEGEALPKPSPVVPVKLTPGGISQKYANAVVLLENYNERGLKALQGSGFLTTAEGNLLTNYHVIRGASRMVARLHDGSTHEVELISGFDVEHDVAAVKIEGAGLPSVQLGSSVEVKTGDHVTALGAPLGLENTLSDGIISAVREFGSFRLLQTTTPISHGSSGGPLFDDFGNVIGLAVLKVDAGENLNFAVPIDQAKPLLTNDRHVSFPELLAQTAVTQPVLTSTVIPAQAVPIDIQVPPQGGRLAGSFSIYGGLGNDLAISLVSTTTGQLVWNGGMARNYATLDIPLRGGRYRLWLNNHVGPFWVDAKTLAGSVELRYYR